MHKKIMEDNAIVLWNSTSTSIYNVDKDDRLSLISQWNLIGRLFKWIRNWYENGGVTARINLAACRTLDEIYKQNEAAKATGVKKTLIYVINRDNSWFFDATAAYSKQYPTSLLKNQLAANDQFSNIDEVMKKALKIEQQASYFPQGKSGNRLLEWDEVV